LCGIDEWWWEVVCVIDRRAEVEKLSSIAVLKVLCRNDGEREEKERGQAPIYVSFDCRQKPPESGGEVALLQNFVVMVSGDKRR
jgi:hypothetical protein